jgi:hypothetical protein
MLVVIGPPGGAAAWSLDWLAAVLMLLAGVMIGMALARRHQQVGPRPQAHPSDPARSSMPAALGWSRRPSPITPPLPPRWLAVRADRPEPIWQALGLQRVVPCGWREGFSLAHEDKLFVSACVNSWVLVMGTSLPDPAEDVDVCFLWITKLSRRLGLVQFFSVNRLLNHHAWVWADRARIVRAYAWAGQTLWNQGRLTPAEFELGLMCLDYATPPPPRKPGQADPLILNTERVNRLAARWSVDPRVLESRTLRSSLGVVGEVSRWQLR